MHEKMREQHYVLWYYNDMSVVSIYSDMVAWTI